MTDTRTRRILFHAAVSLLLLLVFYLSFCLITWDFNPGHWSDFVRYVYTTLTLPVAAVYLLGNL